MHSHNSQLKRKRQKKITFFLLGMRSYPPIQANCVENSLTFSLPCAFVAHNNNNLRTHTRYVNIECKECCRSPLHCELTTNLIHLTISLGLMGWPFQCGFVIYSRNMCKCENRCTTTAEHDEKNSHFF